MRLTGIQLGASAQHGLELRKQQLLEDQLANAKRNEQVKQLQTAANDVLDAFDKAVEASPDESRASVIQQFSQLIPQFKESYNMMGLDPRAMDARFQSTVNRPTKAQLLAQKEMEAERTAAGTKRGTVSETPPDAGGPLVTLEVNGKRKTYRRDDPTVDSLISSGATEVGRQTVEQEIILPILTAKLSGKSLTKEQQGTWDLLKSVGLVDRLLRDIQIPGSTDTQSTLIKQARDAIAAGKDPDAVKKKLIEMGGDPSDL